MWDNADVNVRHNSDTFVTEAGADLGRRESEEFVGDVSVARAKTVTAINMKHHRGSGHEVCVYLWVMWKSPVLES